MSKGRASLSSSQLEAVRRLAIAEVIKDAAEQEIADIKEFLQNENQTALDI